MTSRILANVKATAERHKVLAGVGIALVLLGVVIWLPKLSFIQPGGGDLTGGERAKAETDLRGHLIQVVGGLVLALGAFFTWRTLRLNQEGHRLNQEGQITERFTRAVEQLANDDLDIRLGGIYALERIAHDSETHYEPVMEVLTAFLREHSPWPPRSAPKSDSPPEQTEDKGSESADDYPDEDPALRVDFQAVATVLGRRDRQHERPNYLLNLMRVDLGRAWLHETNLSNAALQGANLSNANLSNANLSEAYFTAANLSNADLSEADLFRASLFGANLSGAHFTAANLSQAKLFDAVLFRASLFEADLSEADLGKADLSEANLSWATLDGADLSGAKLSGATLIGTILSAVDGLTQEQLDEAFTDERTKLPEYLGGEQSDGEDDEDG